MKLIVGTATIMLVPESVQEAGDMQWLVSRFKDKNVRLVFDTTDYMGHERYPMLWVVESEEKLNDHKP